MKLNQKIGEFEFDGLIADTQVPILVTTVVVGAGQLLKRGAVLGIVTDTEKGKLVDGTATDGSQVAKFVLAEDVDATLTDVEALSYKSGQFCLDKLIVASGQSINSFKEQLRVVGIFVESCK